MKDNKDNNDMVSRRGLMQGGALLSAAALLEMAPDMASAAAKNGTPRTLALVGDRYHNPDYIRVALNRTFGEMGLPIDLTFDYTAITADLLKHYDLFMTLRDGMIWPNGYQGPDAYPYQAGLENPPADGVPPRASVTWITADQGKAIKDFVNGGGGLYTLHNSSNISNFNADFRDVMGGEYIGHPAERPFQCRATKNAHPITAGMEPFVVMDEQHFVKYDKDPKYQILESENLDGLTYGVRGQPSLGTVSNAGWAYDYGKGRVVFTAVGHNIDALWNPQYVAIQKRAVHWVTKQL